MKRIKSKLYKVINDLQGGDFAMFNYNGTERIQTVEGWRKNAMDWADADDSDLYGTIKKLPKNEVMDFIAETWQLEFEEVC